MIGPTIYSLLANNASLTALVPATKIFPYVMNEDTALPAITYMIDEVVPDYNKGGWANDGVTFTISSFAASYDSLRSIVSAIRNAVELQKIGAGTQEINRIALVGFKEGHDTINTFINHLTFKVTVNSY